jgi:hypothetical protein
MPSMRMILVGSGTFSAGGSLSRMGSHEMIYRDVERSLVEAHEQCRYARHVVPPGSRATSGAQGSCQGAGISRVWPSPDDGGPHREARSRSR